MAFTYTKISRAISRWSISLICLVWLWPENLLFASECLNQPWAHEVSDIAHDPAVTFGRLDNGFRYALMYNAEPSDRVSVHLHVKAGSFHETDAQQGVAHFLEHMMFNGSKNFPEGEMIAYFQGIGMNYGSDISAYTDYDKTVYDFNLPAGDQGTINKGLTAIKDWADGALLSPESINRERKTILAEKREEDSIDHRIFLAKYNFIYAGTGLPNRHPIGSEKIIEHANHALIQSYYDSWYRPDNLTLVMVGDFDIPATELQIKKMFSGLMARSSPSPCPSLKPPKHDGVEALYHYEKEANDTTISIAHQRYGKKQPQTRQNFLHELKELGVEIAVTMRLARILESQDPPPFHSALFNQGEKLNTYRYAIFSASCNADMWQKTLITLTKILEQISQYGFLPEEIEFIQKTTKQFFEQEINGKRNRDSFTLSNQIISSINNNTVFISPEQSLELYKNLEQNLTPEALHNTFLEMWPEDQRMLIVAGNAKINDSEGISPEKQIITTYANARQMPVSIYSLDNHVTYPYLSPPEGSVKVKSRNEIDDLGIIQITYGNGVKLNLKQTAFDENTIYATLRFGNGSLSAPKAGFGKVGSKTIDLSGLGKLSPSELAESFAKTDVAADFLISLESFLIKGHASSDKAEKLFQVIYHLLLDPGFRPDMMVMAKQRILNEIKDYTSSVDYACATDGFRFLMGGNPLLGLPTLEEINDVEFDEVKGWIDEARFNAPLELSVIGDFEEQEILELADKYFGSLPPRSPLRSVSLTLNFPEGQRLIIPVNTVINRANVMVAWPILDRWDISLRRKLIILVSIFENKLIEQLREKMGVAYSPEVSLAFHRVFKKIGFIQADALIDPADSDNFIVTAEKIANDLCQQSITEVEFRRAVQPILSNILKYEKSNSYWQSSVLENSSLYPEQFEWHRMNKHDYQSITRQDIQNLSCKYLDNMRHTVIIGKPSEQKQH